MSSSLKSRLDALNAAFRQNVPQDKLALLQTSAEALKNSGLAERAIKLGDPLPAFSLPDQNGRLVSSTQLLASGPLVISIFRGSWCGFCMTELQALEEMAQDVRSAGATLIAITAQTEARSLAMKAEKNISFDILTDRGLTYADSLGVVFRIEPEIVALYREFGIDLEAANGDDSWRLPLPVRLVVDRRGLIVSRSIDSDYTSRPEPADTLAALRNLAVAS